MEIIGHLKRDDQGAFEIQTLEDHLNGVSKLAAAFCSKFENEPWGLLSGCWHDLGKYSSDFQKYIRSNSGYEEDDQQVGKVDHSTAGAIIAQRRLDILGLPLAYAIAGHHAGLLNWFSEIGYSGCMEDRLKKPVLVGVEAHIPQTPKVIPLLNQPCGSAMHTDYIHFWIRMLFSALVDADRLDTERFMNPESYVLRGRYQAVDQLCVLFNGYMKGLSACAAKSEVNAIRASILKECVESAKLKPGFFSITVPTGGGKTLSAMAWALEHAAMYGKERIIFAIPYTSIITQTAAIYRSIFGEQNVVEHHSNIDEEATSMEAKLAVENWDAPIVVTTNVQLFESLFASKTSQCRKLHNLANSIIILDEAQMLPPELLDPILSSLNFLVKHFKTSILLSTATQPSLVGRIGGNINGFMGIEDGEVREVVANPNQLFDQMRRVDIHLPEDLNTPMAMEVLASELCQYEQVLCIVNTRKECRELFKLMPEGTIHLSRMMCTAHIMDTIRLIKETLQSGEPIRVISTQLIEAGVDVDFPVVYRALAGLDSIAQSAGRCNREGKLSTNGRLGITKVFVSENGVAPGLMRKGSDASKEVLYGKKGDDVLQPSTFNSYFKVLFGKVNSFDKPGVKRLLCENAREFKFQFATASAKFRLIDDKGAKVVLIRYGKGADYVEQLRRKGPESWLMRKLQQYSVAISERDFNELKKGARVEEVFGCWVQADAFLYNSVAGLKLADEWIEEILIA